MTITLSITIPDPVFGAMMFACGAMLVWNALGLIMVFCVEKWKW